MTRTPDLRDFAAGYTAAWCSGDPARVASFYTEDGSLTINDGPASIGRAAIAAAASGFMTAFPDMIVRMDGVDTDGEDVVYRWTLAGTNTGPGGTGRRIRIGGFERWTLSPDGRIAASRGHFDESDYRRQLESRAAPPSGGDRMDPLLRAVRTLTIAVWCLCGLFAAQLAFYGYGYVQSSRLWRRAGGVDRTTTTVTRGGLTPVVEQIDGRRFHDLPPEEKVARSSAILLVSYQRDGERFKAVVAEVLKLRPETELYYSVGDEVRELSYYPKADESRGEGQVVFMVGSPAEFRSSYSFHGGRIGGMGEMPIEVLRAMVKRSKP